MLQKLPRCLAGQNRLHGGRARKGERAGFLCEQQPFTTRMDGEFIAKPQQRHCRHRFDCGRQPRAGAPQRGNRA